MAFAVCGRCRGILNTHVIVLSREQVFFGDLAVLNESTEQAFRSSSRPSSAQTMPDLMLQDHWVVPLC